MGRYEGSMHRSSGDRLQQAPNRIQRAVDRLYGDDILKAESLTQGAQLLRHPSEPAAALALTLAEAAPHECPVTGGPANDCERPLVADSAGEVLIAPGVAALLEHRVLSRLRGLQWSLRRCEVRCALPAITDPEPLSSIQ